MSMTQLVEGQAQNATIVNENFAAVEPAGCYGYCAETSSLLTWGYYGGNAYVNGAVTAISAGTLSLTASSTNYVQANPTTGAVSSNTTGFTSGYLKLYEVVTNGTTVTGYTDKRFNYGLFALTNSTREKLTAARTYYVRTDGSDSNDGLSNTAGGAFLTVQKGIDTIAGLDNGGYAVTLQLGDGTYTGAVTLKRFIGSGTVTIQGNSGTPANVLVSTTSSSCFSGTDVGAYTVKDMKLQTTTSGNGIYAFGNTTIYYSNINFGACAGAHIYAESSAQIYCNGSYAISGAAGYHVRALVNAVAHLYSATVTITGTPAFSTAFAQAARNATINSISMTFSGAATGVRYDAHLNGVINTYGGGASYFPGNSAGSTATGGQYA